MDGKRAYEFVGWNLIQNMLLDATWQKAIVVVETVDDLIKSEAFEVVTNCQYKIHTTVYYKFANAWSIDELKLFINCNAITW